MDKKERVQISVLVDKELIIKANKVAQKNLKRDWGIKTTEIIVDALTQYVK